MIPENDDIAWTITDPQKRKVVLKRSTLDKHIAGADHDPRDSEFRKKIMHQAQQTIVDPEFIIKENSRNTYLSLVNVPYQDNFDKLKTLKIVVDSDRHPNEVVTWLPLKKFNSTIESEAIIYARKSNVIVSDSLV